MSAWLFPGLGAGLWLGLLAAPTVGDRAPVWVWLVLAFGSFGGGASLGPPRARDGDPLAAVVPSRLSADLVLEAVAPERLGPRRAPPAAAAALAFVGALALGIGWGSLHAHHLEGAVLAGLAPARVEVEGVLRTDLRSEGGDWWAAMDVRIVRIGGRAFAIREGVWLGGDAERPAAVRGDRVRVSGRVMVPDDEGFATFLLRRGMVAQVEAGEIVRLGPSDVAPIRWAQAFRALVGGSLRERFPAREAGLLLGLSLGDDSLMDPAVERDFRASGLSHLLVVSGGNVAMVLGPVLAFGSLARLSRWPRFVPGVGTVAFFVVLTGAEPSVMRAGVMAGLTLLGILLGRPRSTGTILAAAVFGLLVLDPALVWSVGFQLSVTATAGMVAAATPLAERMPWLPRPVALAAGATLAAQIAVTPLLLFHFHEYS